MNIENINRGIFFLKINESKIFVAIKKTRSNLSSTKNEESIIIKK